MGVPENLSPRSSQLGVTRIERERTGRIEFLKSDGAMEYLYECVNV